MESIELWQTAAFCCVLFAFFVYSILDGFDLGLGILMPFAAKDDAERMSLFKAIAPFWDGNGSFALDLACLLKPLPYALATTLLALMLLHTVSYLVWKVDGALKDRLIALGKGLWIAYFPLLATSAALLVFSRPEVCGKPLFWLGAALAAGGAIAFRALLSPLKEKALFAATSLAMAGLWLIAAAALFPNIVNPLQGGGEALITIHNASSPLNTLKIAVGASIAGAVIIISYTCAVYWLLGKKTASKAN